MSNRNKLLDAIRRASSERENHIIDEYMAGYIGRRAFLRHASVAGMALPAAGAVLGAFGTSLPQRLRARPPRRPSGSPRPFPPPPSIP